MGYQWDFAVVWRYSDLLVAGGIGTLRLAAAALALAIPLGLLLAILRMTGWPVISWIAVAYIDFFRSSAALVLLVWFYYALPVLIGVDFDAFAAATMAVGFQSAAYFAEVFRSGIQSIGRGQWDGARAIGMRYGTAMRHIILPQAIRRVIPVLFTRVIELLKTTALAASITYAELVYNANDIAAKTFRPIETFTIVALIYFVVIFTLSQIVRWLERRLAASD